MKYTFKTNIKCGGCIAQVQPSLDGESAISNWQVDTDHADKLLTVETDTLDSDAVIKIIEAAGFEATEKKKGLIGKLFG